MLRIFTRWELLQAAHRMHKPHKLLKQLQMPSGPALYAARQTQANSAANAETLAQSLLSGPVPAVL